MAENDVDKYKVVVIGGSAGSLEVILNIISFLGASIRQPIVLVLHRKSSADSILVNLLTDRTSLGVKEVEDKDAVLPSTVYIAPGDYHLLFESSSLFALDSSEKLHFSRPSIDVTFESAAETFGAGCIGILLSGANADGAKGLSRIQQAGGLTIAQDPATAEVDYMPRQAIKEGAAQKIVRGDQIGSLLKQLL
jgi:two-component system, chemotaxis family, protein-glutamate methylesterase/glutaminase